MRWTSLVVVTTLASLVALPAARADGRTRGSHRGDLARGLTRSSLYAHASIPAWARRYNVNCSHCHTPAVPRLNATGIRFRWAGYRMPEDLGTSVNVEKVQNYLAARGRIHYDFDKTQGRPTTTSSFAFPDATIFYSGPFGKSYGAFFELERAAEDNLELQAHVESAWGKEKTGWGGFRVGVMHWLLRDGVAGFDRPTGVGTTIPLSGTLTSAIPFTFGNDQFGLEAYYVKGRNRISVEMLNGINAEGKGDEKDPDNRKDFVLSDQLLFDEAGSGLTAVGYFGTLKGADPTPSVANLTSHFWRVALSANKFFARNWEAQGGVAYGQDKDLPVVTGGAFTTPKVKGLGYWVYAGYTFASKSADAGSTPPTLFGRFDFLDPNTSVDNNARHRLVGGLVLPVSLPEYLRIALEYSLDLPQGGGAKRHIATAELMINF